MRQQPPFVPTSPQTELIFNVLMFVVCSDMPPGLLRRPEMQGVDTGGRGTHPRFVDRAGSLQYLGVVLLLALHRTHPAGAAQAGQHFFRDRLRRENGWPQWTAATSAPPSTCTAAVTADVVAVSALEVWWLHLRFRSHRPARRWHVGDAVQVREEIHIYFGAALFTCLVMQDIL